MSGIAVNLGTTELLAIASFAYDTIHHMPFPQKLAALPSAGLE
jgi:hypothetical protein